ncbi:MAG: hypothetical protein AB7N65_25560 [Vicinamibacterales bacterium]
MPSHETHQSDTSIRELIDRIRAEFLEMPGLRLTLPQAQRFWGLDETTSAALLGALTDGQFLRRTASGTYIRAAT